MRKLFVGFSFISLASVAGISFFYPSILWVLVFIAPIILCGTYDMLQNKHSLMRNFPVIGHGRWILESIRPPIRQYFIESDIDGVPINRMTRGLVYRRSKKEVDTLPFGSRMDVYKAGYEWISHSLNALNPEEMLSDIRVQIGGINCKQPYSASLLNISAMSYGALSKNAILSLNAGAKQGNFAHNTGEGGLSKYHLANKGDLIWQIGTGYFGCRDQEGLFSPEEFKKKATLPNVKMIEIKLSQGAKPGHGGILPADKNTPEIAKIRGVDPHIQINSPPTHNKFSTPIELLQFIQELRDLSEGKPVGFKLCIGKKSEFISICKAMVQTKIIPDFIVVDGGEGGTGAAPLEYTNSVGMPLKEGLSFVDDALIGFSLRKEIKLIAGGKIFSGIDLIKNLALGADLCYSARGMMLALGCIQALQCHKNKCPTGIATQDPMLSQGLVVENKKTRVSNYHEETIRSVIEILAATGLQHPNKLKRSHIYRRINEMEICRYDEIFPEITEGCLLGEQPPKRFIKNLHDSSAESF
ncbi:MAG: glutamate synthase domain-containing protein 2 [bacterium]|jgi:glutamate synthase domain-containing protein 2